MKKVTEGGDTSLPPFAAKKRLREMASRARRPTTRAVSNGSWNDPRTGVLHQHSFFSPPYAFFPSSMHAWLTTSVFHYSSRQSLIEPRERHLILRSAFFFFPPIAYLRFLKLGILIGKLKYGVRSHSGAVQSKANETLVRQIALKGLGEQRGVFGSILLLASEHLRVVPPSAITPLAQSFLSQHFYCTRCPRQTAIKPR